MIHDYANPNTCYVIGDCFAILMGPGIATRQPASGVFEEVSSINKTGTTDDIAMWDGTNGVTLLSGAVVTHLDIVDATQAGQPVYNMAVKIGETVYIRKGGTTDRICITGVQVDA
jgi:hypothetical protein